MTDTATKEIQSYIITRYAQNQVSESCTPTSLCAMTHTQAHYQRPACLFIERFCPAESNVSACLLSDGFEAKNIFRFPSEACGSYRRRFGSHCSDTTDMTITLAGCSVIEGGKGAQTSAAPGED